jgi:arginyl-tRNA--protein-N-Asp/Glu arginylyltransferase
VEGSIGKSGPGKRTKVRRYSQAKPSKFCHVCARSADIVELVPCRNVKYGVCRKSVCRKCFVENGWNWSGAVEYPGSFACMHCTKTCPRNAQCQTYGRTNERRRIVAMEKRKLIEDALAEGGDLEAALQRADL